MLWTVQLLIISYGMEIVRRASDFAGPVVWIGMIVLGVWIVGKNDGIVIVSAVLFVIATVGINVVLNFVSPAYDISNAAPQYISFRTGGILTAILSVAVLPWRLWESREFIVYFLGGVGALMGPVFGILVVDYYLIRRQRTLVAELYSEAPEASYYFTRGFNMKALVALVLSGTVGVAVALIPETQAVTALSWPIGAGRGAVLMYALSTRLGRSRTTG